MVRHVQKSAIHALQLVPKIQATVMNAHADFMDSCVMMFAPKAVWLINATETVALVNNARI